MTPKTRPKDEPVRLLFEMRRDDNPRLYDDLIRFNKGTKRVNRLRFLAPRGTARAALDGGARRDWHARHGKRRPASDARLKAGGCSPYKPRL